MSSKKIGTVKWFNDNKGYGFLEVEGSPDVFVHYTQIKVDGFKTLAAGEKVSFELDLGATSGPTALNIVKEQQ